MLAIAGVIFASILLAVPGLHRSSRNSVRRSVAARLSSELENYFANNEGRYPFAGLNGSYQKCQDVSSPGAGYCNDWLSRYISGKIDISDPSSGTDSTIYIALDPDASTLPNAAIGGQSPGSGGLGNIFIVVGAQCGTSGTLTPTLTGTASSKQFAIATNIEDSGYFCIDNG